MSALTPSEFAVYILTHGPLFVALAVLAVAVTLATLFSIGALLWGAVLGFLWAVEFAIRAWERWGWRRRRAPGSSPAGRR